MMRRFAILLCIFSALCAWTVRAEDGEPLSEDVRIRGGLHPTFVRIVFDWDAPIQFDARITDENLVVKFARPGRYDPEPLLKVLSSYVERPQVSESGQRVVLPLKGAFSLSAFSLDKRIVLDLGPAESAEEALDARGVERGDPHGSASASPVSTPKDAIANLRPGRVGTVRRSRRLQDVGEEPSRQEPLSLTSPKYVGTPSEGSENGLAGMAANSKETKKAGRLEVSIGERESLTKSVPLGQVPELEPPIHLRFTWERRPAAAAFRYGEEIWLVFDSPVASEAIEDLEKVGGGILGARQLKTAHGAAIILKAAPQLAARLQLEEKGWLVDLRRRSALADSNMEQEVVDAARNTVLRFAAEAAGDIQWLADPGSRERLVVIPTQDQGLGIAMTRIYPQLQVLQTQQGLVLRPLVDGVEVAVTQNNILVRHKDGLLVSSEETRGLAPIDRSARELSHRLFELSRWRRGDADAFVENKQNLIAAAVAAKGDDLVTAHIALARFYFAWGLATETLGLLNVIEAEAPRMAEDPEVKLMRAVSALLIENYEVADRILSDPALADELEAILWRSAFASILHDWESAVGGFALAQPLIFNYPPHVRNNLLLLGIEARLGVGDTGGASEYLIALSRRELSLSDEARAKYLTGRRFYIDGNRELAEKVWRELEEHSHQASRARARLGLLDLAIEDGRISKDAAIAELERLSFAWRGDDFELAMLLRLSELYEETGRYAEALETLRRIAARFPESKRAGGVAARMRRIFVRSLTDVSAEGLAPLDSLSLFEEFKELTPSDEDGDRIVIHLADRLVEIDLLDKAEELLEEQIRFRREGQSKARLGARLAVVHLLDKDYEAALTALEMSNKPELPPTLSAERRLLRARALSKLQRHLDALAALGADESGEAMLLRAEILWQLKDWASAAKALQRMIPEQPPAGPLGAEAAQRVMNLAIALTMAEKRAELVNLYKSYGESMAETEHAAAFRLLAEDVASPAFSSIEEGLNQVEKAREFYDSYRSSL